MNDNVISATGLIKSWRGRRVLDNVDIDLVRGRVTAVLGPSGTGKSTLLRVIAGLENVDSGQVRTADKLLTDGLVLIPPERRNIGLVFQDFALFPHLSAIDNVMFGLVEGSSTMRRELALRQLDSVQMVDKAEAYPHTLSGGEQQRVALARALAPGPDVVLMDEAFSGLDAKLRVELRNTALNALNESGAAVLVVTHDAEEAMFMADELALMVDGKIIQSGPPKDLYLAPQSLASARLLGEVNSWTGPVRDGKLHSPFGSVSIEKAEDNQSATLMVRPEGLILVDNPTGHLDIVETRFLGASIAITVCAVTGETWSSRMPIGSQFRKGMKVDASFTPHLTTTVRSDR